jgi:hypothetical protein
MDEISPKKRKLDPGSEQAEKIDDKNGYHEVSLEY